MPDFHPWSGAVMKLADLNRPLAILVGASWDRWTRALVEALDDPGVAVALNDFSLVRVDSDLRPDVARRLSTSGSPTIALLTPDGYPLAATTWAPPRAIREFLTSAAFQWKTRALLIAAEARKAQASAVEFGKLQPRRGAVDDAFVRACVEELVETCDPIYGGWGEAPRMLNVAALRLLGERSELPGVKDALTRTIDAMCRHRKLGEPLCHSYDTPNWEGGDEIVLPDEISEFCYLLSKASRVLSRPDFDAIAKSLEPWTRKAADIDGPSRDARTGFVVVSRESTQAKLRAISSTDMLEFYQEILRWRMDPASGLLHRFREHSNVFHLEDQAAALRIAVRLNDAASILNSKALAQAIKREFWDPAASAFRDRVGPPLELGPLDSPQYPVEENAIVAGAMARMTGEWRDLAKACLGSFTDAYLGQGVGAARLALAVWEATAGA